ncbi:MAG: hypothetical protein GY757_23810 [bacterium]|nr:hypothetical protein [bacterium]
MNFANKLETINQGADGILFVPDTIYPDALTAAAERSIEVWDISRINSFRKKLKLEKLVV